MNLSISHRYMFFLFFLSISGCASSSQVAKEASMHQKSSSYYQSIGQTEAAKAEAKLAQEDEDRIFSFETLFIELLDAIFDK